jgi:hypothetical protein
MTTDSPYEPFDQLDPTDGYHAALSVTGSYASLSFFCYSGGVLLDVAGENGIATVETVVAPSDVDRGRLVRLYLVLDAVARYFTTGGSWHELMTCLQQIKTVVPSGLEFPGWFLYDSYLASDGNYQHVFSRADTEHAALWEEPGRSESGMPIGGFIDTRSLFSILQTWEGDNVSGETTEGPGEDATTDPGREVPALPGRSVPDA